MSEKILSILTFFDFGLPEGVRLDVIINPDTEEIIHTMEMGLKGLTDL